MNEIIVVATDTNSGLSPEQAVAYGVYLVSVPVMWGYDLVTSAYKETSETSGSSGTPFFFISS